jgi:uncharacterized membrane protein YoaK (UPF0700 family)
MMTVVLDQLREIFRPSEESPHGPLAKLLLLMTVVSGCIDAFSYLVLGHVFVANMTGNILFLGFAIAGVHGLSVSASLVALGSFVVGATLGGRLVLLTKSHRGWLLASSSSIQGVFVAVALVVAVLAVTPVGVQTRYAIIVILAISMGLQNSVARKLAVPDVTTTVLTMTITGIGADSRLAGGTGSLAPRRMVSIVTLLIGAFVGALLVVHTSIFYPLVVVLALVVIVALWSALAGSSNPRWTQR